MSPQPASLRLDSAAHERRVPVAALPTQHVPLLRAPARRRRHGAGDRRCGLRRPPTGAARSTRPILPGRRHVERRWPGACAWLSHLKHGRIDRIDSLNEHWLEAEASSDRVRHPGPAIGRYAAGQAQVGHEGGLPVGRDPGRPRPDRDHLADAQSFVARGRVSRDRQARLGVGAARTQRIDDAGQLAA